MRLLLSLLLLSYVIYCSQSFRRNTLLIPYYYFPYFHLLVSSCYMGELHCYCCDSNENVRAAYLFFRAAQTTKLNALPEEQQSLTHSRPLTGRLVTVNFVCSPCNGIWFTVVKSFRRNTLLLSSSYFSRPPTSLVLLLLSSS